MDNSRSCSSLDEFLAEILCEPNPASAAAFAAEILYEYSPDQPRDERGRWTTGGGTASGTGGGVKTPSEKSPKDKPAHPGRKETPAPFRAPFASPIDRSAISTPAKVTTIDNPRYSAWSWFWKGAGKPPSVIEKEYGAMKPTIIPGTRSQNTQGVLGGKTIVTRGVPDGFLVGSEGAATCTIVIISMPSSTRPGTNDVVLAHFQAGDNPQGVWDQIGSFPNGTRVAIAGGDDSYPSNTQRLVTIASLAYKKGVTIDGYFNGDGLWVDNRGQYFAFESNVKKK